MKVLDLACKAGGASWGYYLAGLGVKGIDIEPQPNYPKELEFEQADMYRYLQEADLSDIDFIAASPMCEINSIGTQRWIKSGHRTGYVDQITPLRPLLNATGKPWVMENVIGAPLRKDLVLCGTYFGLKVIRHRIFEFGNGAWAMAPGAPCQHQGNIKYNKDYVTVAGHGGNGSNSFKVWCDAMQINWMTKLELSKAIPPAYTQYIGLQIKNYLQEAA